MKRGTLIALGVFAVLLGLVIATREPTVRVGVHKLEPPKLDAARVTSLKLTGPRSALLQKQGNDWFVSSPSAPDVKHPADEALVKGALEALAEVRNPDFVTDRADRQAEYEVDDAKGLKLEVVQEGGPKVEWVLGKSSRNGGVYVREAGSQDIFAQRGRLDWSVRKDVNDWRRRQVLSLKEEELTELVLRPASGEAVTLKAGATPGEWTLAEGTTTPAGFRFSAQAARQVARQLVGLRAQDFLDGDAAQDATTGLAGAHDVVEARLKDGKQVVLHLGTQREAKEGPTTVPARVEGDPQVYLLPVHAASALRKRLVDLRDLGLFAFEPEKVSKVRLQAGGRSVTAVKEAGAWRITEPKKLPEGFDFDPAQVDAQLGWLRGLQAASLLEERPTDAAAGLAAPSALVELTVEGAPAATLRLGKELPDAATGGKTLYARGSVDGHTYAVAEGVKARLEQGLDLFKRRPPPNFAGGGLQGLESLPPEIRRQLEEQLRAASH
ncbi:DUF4340 domain-containing protein [Myxococcus stipitatus]|uniref:DUF4340 domain-containing protein n=1 Tax=Myxococcus stipitatus TaxID=83455 RepID=UPI001F356002|nr:DUF4340 domain-containing protein [Myxococcus stipitatus]MCE9672143.1 DUF4340 domain-containing protein [Myxococcus stipitatus]